MDHRTSFERYAARGIAMARIVLAAVAVALVAPGCVSSPVSGVDSGRAGEPTELQAYSHPPVADLPVAHGFALLEQESRSYEARGVRFVDHVYNGPADKNAVERFYQKQLPARGWEFQSAQMVRGTHTLRFEKDDEILNVVIQNDDRPFHDAYTRVHLAIHPQGAEIQRPEF